MLNVYIVHVYTDKLAHVDNIKLVNPDKIICFANEEHEVDSIFKDFVDQLYPWLVENNKTIDIKRTSLFFTMSRYVCFYGDFVKFQLLLVFKHKKAV